MSISDTINFLVLKTEQIFLSSTIFQIFVLVFFKLILNVSKTFNSTKKKPASNVSFKIHTLFGTSMQCHKRNKGNQITTTI